MLIRVRAAGLCHSDLSVIDGSRPRVMPMVLGHEAAGEVVELGPGVNEFALGDHVVLAFVPSCGRCGPCLDGRAALCEPGAVANAAGSLLSGARRWREPAGEPLHHHLGVSAFADHAVVSVHSAVQVDPELPFEIAALFGCAVLTGVGAALYYRAGATPGDSVAVFGLGGVGLAALLGRARRRRNHDRRGRRASRRSSIWRSSSGRPTRCSAGQDAAAEVRAATGGGATRVIETAGSAAVLAQAYAATRRGGTTVTVGLPDPGADAQHPGGEPGGRGEDVAGLLPRLGSPGPRHPAFRRPAPCRVDCRWSGCLTHRLALEEINEGFDRLARGERRPPGRHPMSRARPAMPSFSQDANHAAPASAGAPRGG